jgi:hypothetical protein
VAQRFCPPNALHFFHADVCVLLHRAQAQSTMKGLDRLCVFSVVFLLCSLASESRLRKLDVTKGVSQYETSKVMLKDLLNLIYNRYEFGGNYGNKFFMASNNVGPETWDILKMKLASKMLTPNSTFLMTFSGSSVTAGHDNHYNQSYPYIVKKRLGDIFSSVGIDLQVHDIALGANACSPYVLCYESMGGSDPDFLNWEQV